MPYITLGVTDGVDTLSAPSDDDAVSAAVRITMGFPFGNFTHTAVYVSPSPFGRHTGYMKLFIEQCRVLGIMLDIFLSQVCTNGYFVFDHVLTSFIPYLFDGFDTYSLVAPFFNDIDISRGVGQIRYEIHTTASSEYLLSNVSKLINEHTGMEFSGEWLLIAEWRDAPAFSQPLDIVSYQ